MNKLLAICLSLCLMVIVNFSPVVSAAAESLPKKIVHGANVPGSLYYIMSAGFAKVISAHTPMKVEVFPQGGTVWYPMLESGEVDFGIQVPDDILTAYKGEAVYEKPTKGKGFSLRTLMLGSPLRVALLVTGNSNVSTPEDIKGLRMPVDYGAFYAATLTVRGLLANYGLSTGDVKGLRVATYVDGVKSLMDGRSDIAFGSLGSGIIEELKAGRGARYLSLDTSPEAVKRMREVHPGYFPIPVKPGLAGVTENITAMGKNITLVASDKLREDVAYEITKAIWENYKELAPVHPGLRLWTPERFVSTLAVVPYHEGSIKFYKEKGVWTQEMEDHQANLMKIK